MLKGQPVPYGNNRNSKWITVPSIFPDPDEIDCWYDLMEGYAINNYETKRSGRKYKKVRTTESCPDRVYELLSIFDFDNWQDKYYWKESWIPFMSGWKRK